MRKTLILIAASLALAAPAGAYERATCIATPFKVVCAPVGQAPNAKVLTGRIERDVTDEERRTWLARCAPRKVFDGWVDRWVYLDKNCESGP